MKDKRDIILEFHSSPDAILNALHQAGWIVETAAERDRLETELSDLDTLYRETCQDYYKASTERDQAREQVKTLLRACKYVSDFSYTDYAVKYGEQSALQELAAIKRHVGRAITAVESEGQ